MWLERLSDFGKDVAECIEFQRERSFGGVKWLGRIDFGASFICPAKDRADPGVGVLEVDACVAGERHHSVDVKYVVLERPVVRPDGEGLRRHGGAGQSGPIRGGTGFPDSMIGVDRSMPALRSCTGSSAWVWVTHGSTVVGVVKPRLC